MKYFKDLLLDISDLIATIETHYPELYKFLGENSLTIPSIDHQDINIAVVQDYLEGLKQLLKHQLEVYQSKKGYINGRNCHIKQTLNLAL